MKKAVLIAILLSFCGCANVSIFPKGKMVETTLNGKEAYLQTWVAVNF